jgi:hypothetical protein
MQLETYLGLNGRRKMSTGRLHDSVIHRRQLDKFYRRARPDIRNETAENNAALEQREGM